MMHPLYIHNCETVFLNNVPEFSVQEFSREILVMVERGWRIVNLFGLPGKSAGVRLCTVLADDNNGRMCVFLSNEIEKEYSSLTPDCIQAHLFEREIFEQWKILPKGHPWLKPVRSHKQKYTFLQAHSSEMHEVAVGPVHAGIIEPGHFRFLCHGEDIFHLEIALGYQHRGVEKALIKGPDKRTVHYMETLAGDSTIGHILTYVMAFEALAGCKVIARSHAIRGIMLELERLANHVGDLGALANDVGYLPTASYCGRLRGDVLNLTAVICGNRFGRGAIRPGGICFDVGENELEEISQRLKNIERDLTNAVELLWNTPSVMDRFEGTGVVSRETAEKLGLVGVVARACGIARDIRFDFPQGIYRLAQLPVSTYNSGDVFARAYTRWLEIQKSIEFIKSQIESLPAGDVEIAKCDALMSETMVVSLTEGWRGEICHTAITDTEGKFYSYKVVDASFHNWMGLQMALRNQQISDFPLCNKSFNLSYCGHDL